MPEKTVTKGKKLSRKEARELDTQISFMEGIVSRDAQYTEAWQILGDFYTRRGKFGRSLEVDRMLTQLEPRNPLVFYNLACSYSLNGDISQSASALDQALLLGYRDFKWLARDPDLRALRKHPAFRSIRQKIRAMTVDVA